MLMLTQETFKLCPDWVEWIGVDDNGLAAGFNYEPLFKYSFGCFVCDNEEGSTYTLLRGVYDPAINLLQRGGV